jgi:hypothetical protein
LIDDDDDDDDDDAVEDRGESDYNDGGDGGGDDDNEWLICKSPTLHSGIYNLLEGVGVSPDPSSKAWGRGVVRTAPTT